MTALAAIYGADFERAEDGRGFTLRVSPHAGGAPTDASAPAAALELRYPPGGTYPSTPPAITVWPLNGLPQAAADALAADATAAAAAAAAAGDVCGFSLATRAADFLADATLARPPPSEPSAEAVATSLWDEAMRRAETEAAAAWQAHSVGGSAGGSRPTTPAPPRAAVWSGAATIRLFDDEGAFPEVAKPATAPVVPQPAATVAPAPRPPPPPRPSTPLDLAADRSISGVFRSVKHSISAAMSRPPVVPPHPSPSPPPDGMTNLRRDLALCHALRLVAASGGAVPPHALPSLAASLASAGVLPAWAPSVLSGPPAALDAALARAFGGGATGATAPDPGAGWAVDAFWKAAPRGGAAPSSAPASRYASDFEEQHVLGRGGFGVVVAATNRLDGRRYAVKKIPLRASAPAAAARILREVATLSRLQHPHVVRYFNCWLEDAAPKAPPPPVERTRRGRDWASADEGGSGSGEEAEEGGGKHWLDSSSTGDARGSGGLDQSSSLAAWAPQPAGFTDTGPTAATTTAPTTTAPTAPTADTDATAADTAPGGQTLFIQMELCPRTLRAALDAPGGVDVADTWTVLRQIARGLAHCHAQGVYHRDLKPANIFFDARGDVRIGDFGLARFRGGDDAADEVNREDEGDNGDATPRGADDATGAVGTAAYIAPEILQGWSTYDERVDLFSLGVIAFELFNGPFGTGMERVVAVRDLRAAGAPPAAWPPADRAGSDATAARSLVTWLLQPNPADRPTAAELLRSDLLPPVVGDEAATDVLRTLAAGGDDAAPLAARVVESLFAGGAAAQATSTPDDAPGAPVGAAHGGGSGATDDAAAAVAAAWRARGAVETTSRGVGFAPPGAPPDAVRLLDSSGAMVALRFEFRGPFAAWAAAHGVDAATRFEVGAIRRRSVGRALPRVFVQGDFDVLTPPGSTPTVDDQAAVDADVIVAALDGVVAAAAAGSGAPPAATATAAPFLPPGVEVRLSHPALLSLALTSAGVPPTSHAAALGALSGVLAVSPADARARAVAWPPARAALAGAGVPPRVQTALKKLALVVPGESSAALLRAAAELGAPPPAAGGKPARSGGGRTHPASPPLAALAALRAALAALGVPPDRLMVDVLLAPAADYVTGCAFAVFHAGGGGGGGSNNAQRGGRSPVATLLAAGGRYDGLLRKLWAQQHASTGGPPPPSPGGVGTTVNIARAAAALGRAPPRRPTPTDAADAVLPPPRLDVVVTSRGGGGLLADRAALAARLRSAGLRAATPAGAAPSPRDAYALARAARAAAIVTLDAATLGAASVARVRWLDHGTDEEVALADVAAVVAGRLAVRAQSVSAPVPVATASGAAGGGGESETEADAEWRASRPRAYQRERAR